MSRSGRRGHGEGSIYRRADGRWVGAVTVEAGKRKYVYGATRQEVQTKVAAARRDLERGLALGDDRQMVGQYLLSWLETMRANVRESTWTRYETHVRVHLVPYIGQLRLTKLTPQHVQVLYGSLLAGGNAKARKVGATGRPLAPTTVQLAHCVLHRALGDAVRLGLVARNVTESVNVPRRAKREMRSWSEEEAQRFLEHVRRSDYRLYAFYLLALTTGMREGELLGLLWRNVDLSKDIVRVRTSLRHLKGRFVLTEPKTKAGRRQLEIDADVVQALREHRARQHRERLLLGEAWTDNGLVFCDEAGGYLDSSNPCRCHFQRFTRACGLPRIRFHDLRHTAASVALANGYNYREVSEMLGHSSASITMDVYVHVQPSRRRALAEGMARAMLGGGEGV